MVGSRGGSPEADATGIALDELPKRVVIADDGAIWVVGGTGKQPTLAHVEGTMLVPVNVDTEGDWLNPRAESGSGRLLFDIVRGPPYLREEMAVSLDGRVAATGNTRDKPESFGFDPAARVGTEQWVLDDRPPQLTIIAADGSRSTQRLDRSLRQMDSLVSAGTVAVVVDEFVHVLHTVDRNGHVQTIAAELGDFEPLLRENDPGIVLVDGVRALWVERANERYALRVVHVEGGRPVSLLEVPTGQTLRLAAAHRGQVAVVVGAGRNAAQKLRVIVAEEPKPEPALLAGHNDPRGLDQLPLSGSTRKTLASWGVTSARDLENRWHYELKPHTASMDPKLELELRYAVTIARRERAKLTPLSAQPIDPAYLAGVNSLGLPADLLEALERAQVTALGLLVVLTEAEIRKTYRDDERTSMITRAEVAAIQQALTERGMALGTRMHDLGQPPHTP